MIRRILPILALGLLLSLPAQARAATVVLVLSESSKVYQDFAQAFAATLLRSDPATRIVVSDLVQTTVTPGAEAGLLVAVGTRAAEALSGREAATPLLLGMVPRAIHDRLRLQSPRAGAVFIDQPPARYINLLRVALPEYEQIGLLVGRDSKESVARLVAAAREQRLRAQSEPINGEGDLFPALQKLFPEGGILLATPDNSVFNAHTLPSILLGAFRRKVPVVGFSPAYVGAGAVIALYSSPEQLGRQSAELARGVLNGGVMPAAQYPRHYSVGVNERVARALGLNLEDAATIKDRLEKLERQP